MMPEREPEPYSMLNLVPLGLKVLDFAALYLRWRMQAMLKVLHFDEGTHRLLEPVSNTTENFWTGVPSPISP